MRGVLTVVSSLIIFMKKRLIFGIIIITALLVGLLTHPQYGSARSEDGRVVTVHIDGQSKTIATNATTVRDILQRLHTNLGKYDKTEPALDNQVKGGDFTVNVYRARPITIVDGANSYPVMTAERSPKKIAQDAGFTTKPEDQFAFQRSDDTTNITPNTQMVIKRAKTITFDLYGTATTLSTNEDSVANLLKERKVSLDQNDELNLPSATRITDGITVSITRIDQNVQTIEEDVPFTEQIIQDVNQPTTYRQVKTPGQNGKKLVTYQITSRNGQPGDKTPLKEVITQQPTVQVVVVGARPFNANVSADKQSIMSAAGIPASDYDYVDYIVTRESGWRVNASNGSTWGLCQALPGSKMSSAGADWQTNPVTQLKWCSGYASGRYGGWAGAYAKWISQHWW